MGLVTTRLGGVERETEGMGVFSGVGGGSGCISVLTSVTQL